MLARSSVVLAATLLLAACTSSAGRPTPSDSTTATSTQSRSVHPVPIVAGPTHAAAASRCPFATTPYVHTTMGMRLGRITVLRSGGKVVGCRFYALQGSYLHAQENLPGPRQPVVEITTQRYASARDAHNAFVLLARAGRNAQQADLGVAVGVCFQTDFDPHDHGQDFACAGNKGSLEVVVRTVDTTGTFNTVAIAHAVLANV